MRNFKLIAWVLFQIMFFLSFNGFAEELKNSRPVNVLVPTVTGSSSSPDTSSNPGIGNPNSGDSGEDSSNTATNDGTYQLPGRTLPLKLSNACGPMPTKPEQPECIENDGGKPVNCNGLLQKYEQELQAYPGKLAKWQACMDPCNAVEIECMKNATTFWERLACHDSYETCEEGRGLKTKTDSELNSIKNVRP